METDKTKKEIRNKIREFAAKLTGKEVTKKSRSILNKLLKLKEFASTEVIFIYVSKDWEVDTRSIIEDFIDKKHLYVPRCLAGDELQAVRLKKIEDLDYGRYGILEPKPHSQEVYSFDSKSLTIVPGMAFDKKGHRIGRGKGCYDRCLSREAGGSPVWGLCFEYQLFENIPFDRWDIKVDGLITEKKVLRFRRS